jgi:hypothetical protein
MNQCRRWGAPYPYFFLTQLNTMKKETAQLLAVLVAACYLIGQLQDFYSK